MAALVVVWDLALILLYWRHPAGNRLGFLLGLVGSVLVSLAWFGVIFYDPNRHAGGLGGEYLLTLVGFDLVLLTLFVIGFAPAGWLRRLAR